MELSKLKHLVRENGDKVILVENGEPELVVMSFAEYEKLARLKLPDTAIPVSQINPKAQNVEPEIRTPADDMHETEFTAPLEIAPIRTASIQGDQFERSGHGSERGRMSDIRLEDLPI
ncbi:MAG: hypothetical protein Q8R30_01440 [bacterium]|nr:hypothetical protein [bacterium]MDZ4285904.1 hypothetical protein [Candidatus Sungbacteria bacterium]